MKIKVSIIIVHYKADLEFFNCLKSIKKNWPKFGLEIIVVDNDETPTIETRLKKEYSFIKYVKNYKNLGFGAANNIGAKLAKGEYLFFLNPDTEIYKNTIENLVQFLDKNKNAAVVAPTLMDENKKVFSLQGTEILTPLNAIFALSFINKYFPNNLIAKKFWLKNINKNNIRKVGVVPGTAFMIRKNIFEKLNGFDENFFLYFEENDLCKRIIDLDFENFMIPDSLVLHLWGRSTRFNPDRDKIFTQSRFYYFKKHFGLVWAIIVELFLNNKLKLKRLSI